jgi:hypothetical protein
MPNKWHFFSGELAQDDGCRWLLFQRFIQHLGILLGRMCFKKYMAHGRLKQLQGEHSPFGIWLSNSLIFFNPNISQW